MRMRERDEEGGREMRERREMRKWRETRRKK